MGRTPTPRFFESLIDDLIERSATSLLGIYGPRTDALRAFLSRILRTSAGHSDSFLADPVFEAIFDWKRVDSTMLDLAADGFLTEELVEAMDRESSDEQLKEYRFPMDRRPFTHQLDAWKHLKREQAQSVLITSGTGSGKTEGFLVPILDDLARQSTSNGRLQGVRALFLYPLNALINSQRARLSAWSRPFNGDIRFCLYKGDTPRSLPEARKRRFPAELVGDRATLRADPPPILVTNATMLEYMLVRAEDKPIIDHSQGLLRWIVLDEAHTYQGSRSAEIALLLRRVLHAFGVKPSQVRFVATSATIGDDSETSARQLRRFLADLGGVPTSRVHIVRGQRSPPRLPDGPGTGTDQPLPPICELRSMTDEERGARLVSSAATRRVRRSLLRSPGAQTLTTLTRARLGTEQNADSLTERRRTLELLDVATASKVGGHPFIRLRGHFLHRTQGGIWACISTRCPGRQGTRLDDFEWAYGKLFFERRERCDECRCIVLAVVLCSECGKEFLTGNLKMDEEHRIIEHREVGLVEQAEDFPELIDYGDDESDVQVSDTGSLVRYLAHPTTPGIEPIHLDPHTGHEVHEDDDGVSFGDVEMSPSGLPRCPECHTRRRPEWLMRPFRGGGVSDSSQHDTGYSWLYA